MDDINPLIAIGVLLMGLVFTALRDIRKTTNAVVIQVTAINGSVKRNAERLDDHIKVDDGREDEHIRERERTFRVLGQIWAKINQEREN